MTKPSVKVLTLITCLSAFPLVIGLMGCAANRTAEPGGNHRTDQHIEDKRTAERVREALAAGADYKYDEVKVITSNGVVRLSGFVKTSAQRSRAVEIASKVVGVKDVANSITVKG